MYVCKIDVRNTFIDIDYHYRQNYNKEYFYCQSLELCEKRQKNPFLRKGLVAGAALFDHIVHLYKSVAFAFQTFQYNRECLHRMDVIEHMQQNDTAIFRLIISIL